MIFEQIDKSEIYENHNQNYYENAIYYNIKKGDKVLCKYGIIPYAHGFAEAFWILDSFDKNVLSKNFFSCLFGHTFSLGYKVICTWTRCNKLISVFEHYKRIGIEAMPSPFWDDDPTKFWFMKRI